MEHDWGHLSRTTKLDFILLLMDEIREACEVTVMPFHSQVGDSELDCCEERDTTVDERTTVFAGSVETKIHY